MEDCHVNNPFLPTWRPPCEPMIFAPMAAANSRIDSGYHNLSKAIFNWQIFWLTFAWICPLVFSDRFIAKSRKMILGKCCTKPRLILDKFSN